MPRSKSLLWCFIAVPVLLLLLACGEASAPAAVVTGTPTVAPTPKPFAIGQPVKVGIWIVTLNKVYTSAGDQFNTPQGVYLIIDASFQNTSADKQTLSGLIQFTLTDSTGQKYESTIVTLAGITPPDGDVLAGKTARGETTYDVPKTVKSFEFTFLDELAGSNTATWDFTVK